VPDDVTARHRAGGIGRLVALRAAAPRHAAAPAVSADGATMELPVLRSRHWPMAVAVLAVLMLVAVTPLVFRRPDASQVAVPLPTVSIPPPPTGTVTPSAPASRRPLQAVRQAAKARPAPSSAPGSVAPVLLGPATDTDLPALLGSYCRVTYGRLTLAASTSDGWFCAPLGRATTAIDMDAMCRWRYGTAAWADLGDDTDPRSWRCYRDGP
jgi:hypothetical protein